MGQIDTSNRTASRLASAYTPNSNQSLYSDIQHPQRNAVSDYKPRSTGEISGLVVQIPARYDQAELMVLLRKYSSVFRVVVKRVKSYIQVEFFDAREAHDFMDNYDGIFVTELGGSKEESRAGENRFERLVGAGTGVKQKVIELK